MTAKRLLLIIALLVLPSISHAQDSHKATVYFYRGNYHVTFGKIAPPVYANKVKLAKLDEGRWFAAQFDPGSITFTTDNKKNAPVTIDLKAGQVYYIRMDMQPGWYKPRSLLIYMQAEQGSVEIKNYRPIKPGDIKDPRVMKP